VVLTAGLTYLLATHFGGRRGSLETSQLSPDVQKYIDAKLGSGQTPEEEVQTLLARVTEMEKKLVEVERVRASHERLAVKSEAIETAINEQRRSRDDALQAARTAELTALRNEIATACAGVAIKRVPGRDRGTVPGSQGGRTR
jgi:hypothetical protein